MLVGLASVLLPLMVRVKLQFAAKSGVTVAPSVSVPISATAPFLTVTTPF